MTTTAAPPFNFTYTNDSIIVIPKGQKPTVVQRTDPRFVNLRQALYEERWEDALNHLTVKQSLTTWAKGRFTLNGDRFSYNGELIDEDFNKRIVEMASAGEDPEPLFKFWERLQKNPSFRSVQQLWGFLKHQGIPLDKDGCFLAYKSVRLDYRDHYSGTFENRPGAVLEMPRNKISDDPNHACHEGFHVGAIGYASTFHPGVSRIMICKVDPQDVVCVPYDRGHMKMRVCKYVVVGHYNGEVMPSTTYDTEVDDAENDDIDDYDADTDEGYDELDDEELTGPQAEAQARQDGALEDIERHVETAKEIVKEVAQKVEETKTSAEAEKKLFAELDGMDAAGLLKQPIHVLRHYASKHCKLVGASKLGGGKYNLVTKILETRK